MKKITGVLIDVIKRTVDVKRIDNSIDTFYKILNCDGIECPQRIIEDQRFIIVCDEQGALKKDRKTAAIIFENDSFLEIIYGNIFITKFDGVDDFASLNGNEIKKILKKVIFVDEKPILFGNLRELR